MSGRSSRHSIQSEFNDSFTAINIPDSPSQSKHNLTGLPRTVKDCSACIYNSIQEWNSLHVRGSVLIKEIALLKTHHSEEYPKDLEALHKTLTEIMDGIEKNIKNLEKLVHQLSACIPLHKTATPLFVSWPIEKFADVAKKIYNDYFIEFQLKQFVVDNICHVKGREKLMFYASCWVHQPYISSELKLLMESLLVETGLRNIN